jgi:hypothetical protein
VKEVKYSIEDDLRSRILTSGKSAGEIAEQAGMQTAQLYRFLGGGKLRTDSIDKLLSHFDLTVVSRDQVVPRS